MAKTMSMHIAARNFCLCLLKNLFISFLLSGHVKTDSPAIPLLGGVPRSGGVVGLAEKPKVKGFEAYCKGF